MTKQRKHFGNSLKLEVVRLIKNRDCAFCTSADHRKPQTANRDGAYCTIFFPFPELFPESKRCDEKRHQTGHPWPKLAGSASLVQWFGGAQTSEPHQPFYGASRRHR